MTKRKPRSRTSARKRKTKTKDRLVVAAGQLPVLPIHTLGWKGFQDLCATILSEILGQTYSMWSPTGDGGRDAAFVGSWKRRTNESLAGNFVVQCKHTSDEHTRLTWSLLKPEFAKVSSLVKAKLADVYVFFTNHRITGELERQIGRELRRRGVKRVVILGDHWISRQVYESSRLRALVPRVYGLGDLSEIVDQRAYEQASAVLKSLEDEIRTFVPVDAYRRAYSALDKQKFVCLVGEPGSGKSTIAAILTLLAADQWHLAPVRVMSPEDFKRHWNPNRADQIFWVDDAFGDTQYDGAKTSGWRALTRDMRAAMKAGARFIMTTRDYIFRRAHDDFRAGDFPITDLYQVVIAVEELSIAEKEAILYNHIKLGEQPKAFRTAIKKHLPIVAQRAHMLPEVAKRLAAPFFTASLKVTAHHVAAFAEDPSHYLLEVLRGLDRPDRTALVLLFARGGAISSPITIDPDDSRILEVAGASVAEVSTSFSTLRNTLVRLVLEPHASYWTYRHPTVHDAVSSYVASDPELAGVYLRAAPAEHVVAEVYFADGYRPEGAKIAVPRHLYGELVERIATVSATTPRMPRDILHFLAYRVDDEFLKMFVERASGLPDQLMGFYSYIDAMSEMTVLERMHELGLLSKELRRRVASKMMELAVSTPDAYWVDAAVITTGQRAKIRDHVRTELVDNIEETVRHWKDNCSPSETPSEYFALLKSAFRSYQKVFERAKDSKAVGRLKAGIDQIDTAIEELDELYGDDRPPAKSSFNMPRFESSSQGSDLTRFDDLDE